MPSIMSYPVFIEKKPTLYPATRSMKIALRQRLLLLIPQNLTGHSSLILIFITIIPAEPSAGKSSIATPSTYSTISTVTAVRLPTG